MAVELDINLNGDKIWGDDPPSKIVEWDAFTIATLIGGMASGKPSVGIITRDGDTGYVAQTSLVNFLIAADMFNMTFGEPRDERWEQPEVDEMRANLKRWYDESVVALDEFAAALKEPE